MAEDAVVQGCQRELTKRLAWWANWHGTEHGRTGIPDILACYRGLFLGIECKAPDGRLRPRQRLELDLIRQAGGIALVVRSRADLATSLDELDEQLAADLDRAIEQAAQ